MAKEKENLFRGYANKLKLVSNNLCYGPPPKAGEEVEQRITISKDGIVRFSGYGYDEQFKMVKLRQFQKKISIEEANYYLAAVGYEFSMTDLAVFATDIGSWDMEITTESGDTYKSRGALFASSPTLVLLSSILRGILKHEDLFMFDGAARFKISRNPDEKIFVEVEPVTGANVEPTWYFFEGDDICVGDKYYAPTRRGCNSFLAEVTEVVVARPEEGPVSLKEQQKMKELTLKAELPSTFDDFINARKRTEIWDL